MGLLKNHFRRGAVRNPGLSHKFILNEVPHRLRWEFPSVFAAHEDVRRARL